MSERHHCILFTCSLMLPAIGACAPTGKTAATVGGPAPAPALTTAATTTTPTTDLDAHQQQVRQDTEAFLAYQQQQRAAAGGDGTNHRVDQAGRPDDHDSAGDRHRAAGAALRTG